MAERVLIVDDEEEFLEVFSERMRARGFEVTTSSSASEALKLTEELNFDAIILDLMMPGMDGIETLQRIRDIRPESQVILLTGHASLDKGIEAMKDGAFDFIEKPADINKLTEKIKKAKAKRMIIVEKQMENKIEDILKNKGW